MSSLQLLGLRPRWVFRRLVLLTILASLVGATDTDRLYAATTGGAPPAGQPMYIGGLNSGLLNGDFVSNAAAPGLASPWIFVVEVPPGTPQMTVSIFDADIGAGPSLDFLFAAAANTSVTYRVINPLGAVIVSATIAPGTGAGLDNVWASFAPFVNPIPGHWRIEVDQTANGTQMNGLGLRVNDGDITAAGVELNVYAPSFMPPGMVTASGGSPQFHDYFPYITSGCEYDLNDFDGDSVAGNPRGFATANSPTDSATAPSQFTTQLPVSGPTVWRNSTITGWANDQASAPYGLWHLQMEVGQVTTSNWLTFFTGAYNAADPPTGAIGGPPTAQPEANSHRVYLPPDAFTPAPVAFPGVPPFPTRAPRKPFVEQVVKLVSGPNPPQPNQTTRVEIEIYVTNPAPFPIAFSAPTNVVTASVPGPPLPGPPSVVYAGNASASQGTVVAQPALGATGAVRWNPGVVAANTVATLSYHVDVTPAMAGQRLLVTGGLGSGGTTARFVDETCASAAPACTGTQLATATYTFGQLCPLAVEVDLLTEASIGALTVALDGDRRVITWNTHGESGTAGFHLLRRTADGGVTRVTETLVPSLAHVDGATQGGRYQVVDEGAEPAVPGTTVRYELLEVEATGSERRHGPFAVPLEATLDPATTARMTQGQRVDRRAHATHPAPERPALETTSRPPAKTSTTDGTLKIGIETQGVYRIAAADLATAFGVDTGDIMQRLADGNLALHSRGLPVHWTVNATGDALIFYGVAPTGEYARDNVYWLRLDAGTPMALVDATSTVPASPDLAFSSRIDTEVDAFAALGLPIDPEAGYWFWKAMAAGGGSDTATVTVDAPNHDATTTGAFLRVGLHGASTTGTTDEHHVQVWVNASLVGETWFSGIAPHEVTVPVDGVLQAGENTIEVVALLDPDVSHSFVYLDQVSLDYPRRYQADGSLAFRGDAHPRVRVVGFAPSPLVLDISQPLMPLRVAVSPVSGGFDLVPASPTNRYWAVDETATMAPSSIVVDQPSNLLDPTNAADMLIITDGAFAADPALANLANHRRAQGLSVVIVDTADIMDEMNHGIVSPWALRDFLAATRAWSTPPRYVLLAGGGTWDHRDVLGRGGNRVPVVLTSTPKGLFPADNRFADFDEDGVPDVAIGRLPATDAAGLAAAIDKIIAHETSLEPLAQTLLAADAPDGGTNFATSFDGIRAGLPEHYDVTEVDLGTLPLASARQALVDGWHDGLSWFDYHGHGNIAQLGTAALLTAADVSMLTSVAGLPVVTAMTCTANRFDVPGFPALGAHLINEPDGGALAVWSPSGLSVHHGARDLAQRAYHEAFAAAAPRLGDAVNTALASLDLLSGPRVMREVYTLLGDPALRLRTAPVPAGPVDINTGEAGLPFNGVVTTCEAVDVIVPAGDSTTFTCSLRVEGAQSYTADLTLEAPAGWPATVDTPTIEIGPDQPATVTLSVAVPTSATVGRYPLRLVASDGGTLLSTAKVEAVVHGLLRFADGFETGDLSAWTMSAP